MRNTYHKLTSLRVSLGFTYLNFFFNLFIYTEELVGFHGA